MKIVNRVLLIIGFLTVLTFAIAFARGYRINLNKKVLTSTGIINISAYPKASKVFVDSELKGVTDINLTLAPGKYQIDIKKDGYTSWSKNISLKGELVETVDALLFPINASLSPLTNLGVTKTVAVDKSNKIIIFSDNQSPEKDGIYIFEPNNKPIAFFPPLRLIALKTFLPQGVDFTKAEVVFSPDLKQAIFEFDGLAYLFSLDEENKELFEITGSKDTLLSAWEEEKQKKITKILETFPKEIVKIASGSFEIIDFSPDETRVFYRAKKAVTLLPAITPPLIGTNQTNEERILKKDSLYVYDKKEDKNYLIANLQPKISKYSWYYDSDHLVLNEDGTKEKISIVDYDGINKQAVYSGPFESSFYSVTTDGKIIVLANLNPEANALPDLYLVGIK